MATVPKDLSLPNRFALNRDSRQIILDTGSHELVFAVVGHAGSGTSAIAKQMADLLISSKLNNVPFTANVLKARDVIAEWATSHSKPVPTLSDRPTLAQVTILQDYGDQMREELTKTGSPDYAAVARRLVRKIKSTRESINRTQTESKASKVEKVPTAYILDSIRHPAEVRLLRHIYGDAFVLIGVVCEEEKRITRLGNKYKDAGRSSALDFMKRDADASEKHGQHVGDAFHLSDYFIDNTVDRLKKDGSANSEWDVTEKLSRLVKIVTHSQLVRPLIAETAMYHAAGTQMQSACLSRQVGAAVVDINGNLIATGTNEAPKAGGGVYGESFKAGEMDSRCAMFSSEAERFCRNTVEQNRIIDELIEEIPELKSLAGERKRQLSTDLRKTRIGSLLEFSRAVHAEMDALLSAAREAVSLVGTRIFVTTFPCHYCARHIVSAGVDEVQYIEPYPKSQALNLHKDAIVVEHSGWVPPSQGGTHVLFRPFSGVAPILYKRAFLKYRDLKDNRTGKMIIKAPEWGTPWHLSKISYLDVEAELCEELSTNE
jgi:deoxycytidylate deaminase